MPQDNDRIIEIAANLSQSIKQGVIDLLQAGAPSILATEVLDATSRLDRAAQFLVDGGAECGGEFVSGQLTTIEDPAIAELQASVGKILEILSTKPVE